MPSGVGYPGSLGPPLQPADGTLWSFKDGRWQAIDAATTKAALGLATSTTDNAVIRADGTAGGTQNSGVIVDDSNNVTGVVALTIGGALAGATTIANSGIQTNSNATDATNISTGCLTLAGGLGITKALWVGGLTNIAGAVTITSTFAQTGAGTFSTGTGAISLNGATTVVSGKQLNAADTTDATTASTGAFITAGGVGIAKALWVGGLGNIAGVLTVGGAINIGTGSSYANARMYVSSTLGVTLALQTGSSYDFYLGTPTTGLTVMSVVTGTRVVTFSSAILHTTDVALTNGAAAQTATMTNGPTAGNPTKWAPVNDNGTTRYVPMW